MSAAAPTPPSQATSALTPPAASPVTAALDLHFDTKKVHSSYLPSEHQNSLTVPIYQNTAFEFGGWERLDRLLHYEETGAIYTRVGNPTVSVFEKRVADLEGGVAAVATASGMAAVIYSIVNITSIGDHIVSSPLLYGGTFDAFNKVLARFGVTTDYAADISAQAIAERIDKDTKAIFIESISNPLGIVADIAAIAELAHEHGIPLIVDNTQATPYLIRPLELGADVVVYSATKGLSGHGNIVAGLIVEGGGFNWASGSFPQISEDRFFLFRDRGDNFRTALEVFPNFPYIGRLRTYYLVYLGAAIGPFEAYLALLGIETLSERIEKQLANTRALVAYLNNSSYVEQVYYSELPESTNREVARRVAPKGPGTVFSFLFKGSFQQLTGFIEATRIFKYSANLGDARSLIVNSPLVTHKELQPEDLRFAGIPDGLIRISVGLEDPSDLIADLDQAFKAVF
jgi:O-acetylhomoserine (thiol)-lyase